MVKVTAPLLKRIIALVIDLFLINLIVAVPMRAVYDAHIPDAPFDEMVSMMQSSSKLMGISILLMLVWTTIAFLYLIIFEMRFAQTPGMMFMKLKLDGKIDFSGSLLRSLFIFPFFPFYLLWFIEPAFLFFKGQRLTELMTKTRVVQEVNISGGVVR